MSKKRKLIPKLRFPEFINGGNWSEKRISELGDTINGLTGKNGEDFGTGKLYVTYKQVFDNSIIDFRKCGKVEIDENENQNTLQKGDILFTTSSETPNEVGFASVLVDSPKENVYLNSFCFALRPFELENTQPQFSRYLFHSPVYRKSVTVIAQGSTRYNLSKVAFLNLKVPIPESKEQQKVASCISSLDEVIIAETQKLDLLKDHKKGLMQNLFPQEGQKVPKYRFKEFENDGVWVKKRLGDLGHFLGGGTPSRSNEDYWIGNIPWISSSDIKEDDIHNISISQYINENAIIESATKKIPKGSVLFVSRVGVGKLAINTIELCTSQDFTSFLPKKDVLNFFIGYYFSAKTNLLLSLNQGTSIKGFSKGDFENLILPYHNNIKEHKKIASCLFALDELIMAQAERIEQLKKHKTGLMQGLFPKTEN
jgi:type I restriction enzyme, S subunit